MIAPETIDRIRDQADLVEIVGQSVKLERRGRNWIGLCPFHKEKSPSFNVNEERGFYHCFGCKASGDVFRFVQETEGLSFIEAVRSLAEKLAIEISDDLSSDERRQRDSEKRRELALYEVNLAAAVFFEERLENDPNAKYATGELAQRGLPWTLDGKTGPARETLRSFRIGYAPEGWDSLAQHLTRIGHDPRVAEAVGLLVPRRGGPGYYDRFRHRLMFAVIDLHGRIVAFSGRALPQVRPNAEETPAKYLNSPESPIYKKRATVFGLYQARSALRSGKSATVVEGNFDVVSLHAAGFTHAVAPLGTAFTEEQGKLIRRFTQNVTLLFDGDAAGRKATTASRGPAKDAGLVVKVARLPAGSDPDEFLRSKGAENLTRLLSAASGMVDYLIAEILDESFNAADALGRATKLKQVTDLLASEEDPNVRALAEQHADRLAGRLGVADAHTFRALKATITRSLQAPTVRGQGKDRPSAPPKADQAARVISFALGALLDFPELLRIAEVQAHLSLLVGDLAAAVAALLSEVEGHGHAHGSPSFSWSPEATERYIARVPGSLKDFTRTRIFAPQHADIDVARVELFANFDKLRRMELTKQSSGMINEIERAQKEGDFDQELELLKEQASRARKRHGL